jgi:hypothetical protein
MELIGQEMKKLKEDMDWYGFFAELPFAPSRFNYKGSVERALEDRPRPTHEGGAPRKPITDEQGIPVISTNDACGMKDFDVVTAEQFLDEQESGGVRMSEDMSHDAQGRHRLRSSAQGAAVGA